MKKIALILGLMAFISVATATSIESENVVVDLEDYSVEKEVHFNELTSSRMTYITNHPVNNLYVEIEGEEAECEFNDMDLGGEISCETDVFENFDVYIEYDTSGLSTPRNGANVFRYSQNIYRPTDDYTFRAVLPEGTGVLDQANVSTPVVEPEFGEVGSEGRRIHVEWNQDPSLGETISFQVVYEDLGTNFRTIIILLTLIVVLAGSVRFYRKYRSSSEASKTIDSLQEGQRQVVEMLQEEGSMLQKDIVNESEYSKAKISGLVGELEEKGIITKEKEGRSNRVKLVEKHL